MNKLLQEDLRVGLEKILSFDNDSELFKYQYINEKQIGRFLGKGYTRGTSSGTAALQFSLLALGIDKGNEVITVPNTYIGTLLAISNTGARPVLVDILPDTMLIDPGKIEEKITRRTKAIMPVHLYGQMADMNKIIKIARKHNLCVIEDACQAHLAKYEGHFSGEKSDAACYSFFPNKNLGGISNGGMVITKKKDIYRKVEKLRNPTSDSRLVLKSMRTPAYLDWNQIVFIKARMKYLHQWTEKRREIAKRYFHGLKDLPLILPGVDRNAYHVFRNFVIRTAKRDRLKRFLTKAGIETVVHYPLPLHLSRTFDYLDYQEGDFPVSESIAEQVLSIPINPFLTSEEVDYIIYSIKSFFGRFILSR